MPSGYPLPTLTDRELVLRPTIPSDVDPLLAILADPVVAEWWGDNTAETLAEELAGAFTIEVDATIAGLLECHEESDETYPEVSFDIVLGTDFHGRHLGRRALRMAIDHFVGHGHHRFTIDPAVDNAAAVRSYRAVGFKPVGVLRAAERSPRGDWRDGLLMDLLAWELPEPGTDRSAPAG